MFGHRSGGLIDKKLQAVIDYSADGTNPNLETCQKNLQQCNKFAHQIRQILDYIEANEAKLINILETQLERDVKFL